MTKQDKVKQWLQAGNTITGIEALKMFGLYRLSDAIFKLRGKGMKIKSEDVKENGSIFARYSLINE